MTAETIEGEARELVIQPERLSALTPESTVTLATRMATALKDIVEKQRLYAVINGRKYPQVEAWMTIARMDNVVAREVPDGIVALEDGSYEATVELIRLSDGMIVGRGSALCGSDGDEPWHSKRPAPARRSMAVTRATSRAFRQQYSWIMALAGYEPTPAEEMPRDEPTEPTSAVGSVQTDGSLIGIVEAGRTSDTDYEYRPEPEGVAQVGFVLVEGRKRQKVHATGDMAEDLMLAKHDLLGQRATCWGHLRPETYTPSGSTKSITYYVLDLQRLTSGALTIPLPDAPTVPMGLVPEQEAELEQIAASL